MLLYPLCVGGGMGEYATLKVQENEKEESIIGPRRRGFWERLSFEK